MSNWRKEEGLRGLFELLCTIWDFAKIEGVGGLKSGKMGEREMEEERKGNGMECDDKRMI